MLFFFAIVGRNITRLIFFFFSSDPTAPDVSTFIMINNQYYEWYFHRFGKKLDQSRVLPVLKALQGHPESGKLWEQHINNILLGPTLNFKHTTHDCTIYQTTFNDNKVWSHLKSKLFSTEIYNFNL